MARRVRAEAKSLRRCAFAPSSEPIPRVRPQPKVEQELEVLPDQQTVEPVDLPATSAQPAESSVRTVEPAEPSSVPPDEGGTEAPPVRQVPAAAVPLFAQAPSGPAESVMVNAFAMVNPLPPWSAVAECRQQAERLAELENEILEDCRQRQDRLFRAELQEQQQENEQRWRQRERDFEGQIAVLERRVTEIRLSNQEAEMQMQQDARQRYQVVQERCNLLATNLAEEQAEFNAKHFQVEQTVSTLRSELLQSEKEIAAVKLQERTLASCGQEELAAEARCARYVAQHAEQRAEKAEEESQKAQEALVGQQQQNRTAATSFQEQRLELEERLQASEHLQLLARRLSASEEDMAARAEAAEQRAQQKIQEIHLEKEDLASSVRVLTAETRTAQEQVLVEHDQWQMSKLEVKEAQQKQEGWLAEVRAAQDFAADANNRAEAEQRERLRDLQDFQRILRQHQECLDLQQRKEIWAELQKAVIGSKDLFGFETDAVEPLCDEAELDMLGQPLTPLEPFDGAEGGSQTSAF